MTNTRPDSAQGTILHRGESIVGAAFAVAPHVVITLASVVEEAWSPDNVIYRPYGGAGISVESIEHIADKPAVVLKLATPAPRWFPVGTPVANSRCYAQGNPSGIDPVLTGVIADTTWFSSGTGIRLRTYQALLSYDHYAGCAIRVRSAEGDDVVVGVLAPNATGLKIREYIHLYGLSIDAAIADFGLDEYVTRIDQAAANIAQSVPDSPKNVTDGPLVFLCHSSGDKDRVRALYRQLKTDRIKCWFDEEDLMPGDNWDREITRAIKRSKYVLACLSAASVTKSGFVQKELRGFGFDERAI